MIIFEVYLERFCSIFFESVATNTLGDTLEAFKKTLWINDLPFKSINGLFGKRVDPILAGIII
jgi:hypothetical protein